MPEEKRRPIVMAMILCDQVIRDAKTGKTTIVGGFSRVNAQAYPCTHRNSGIYVALTEGGGDYEGCLRLSFAETDEPIMEAKGDFHLPGPLAVAELHFEIRALPLPKPGQYRMEFIVDGEPLMARRFLATVRDEGAEQ